MVGAVALVVVVAGCGSGSGGDKGDDKDPIVVGTMDKVTSLDPAGAYDRSSGTLFTNVYQSLLTIPASGTTPVPNAARKCSFVGAKKLVYRCTLRKGLTFSNGKPLTSKDVKFSFDRMRRINTPTGPASTLSTLRKTVAVNSRTVEFRLKTPDATFPSKIATGAGYIVDHRTYPADKLMNKPSKMLGSGPYKMESYTKNKKAQLVANEDYQGQAKSKNSAVTVRYFDEQDKSRMKKELDKGNLDLIDRGLGPKDVREYRKKDAKGKVKLVEGAGTEIRYLVMNTKIKPFDKRGVRQAIASVVDPAKLVSKVWGNGAIPLYSMIPQGIAGHTTPFFDAYQDTGKAEAKQLLQQAGVQTPVTVPMWYTPTHYGSTSGKELQVIKQQLESSGLFKVNIHKAEWSKYQEGFGSGKYPVYSLGWFADYPDADNYTLPFFGKKQMVGNGYQNKKITKDLFPHAQRETDRKKAAKLFQDIQDIAAKDVPELPLWQGKQYAVTRSDIQGLRWTLDNTMTIRYWMLERGLE